MASSMTRRQFLVRASATLALTSLVTPVLAIRPEAPPEALWSPTFIVTVSELDAAMVRSGLLALEGKLVEMGHANDAYRLHAIERFPRDRVCCVAVSTCSSEGVRPPSAVRGVPYLVT